MSGRLAGQTAWISGAASGIGEAIARLFASQGANVILADVQREPGELLMEQINADTRVNKQSASVEQAALFTNCDVSQPDEIEASIRSGVGLFGGLQIIVNCAGTVHIQTLEDYSVADWDQLMAINVRSIFLSLRYGLPYLRKNVHSYVVNLGSISSFVGQAGTPAYTASKHAVLGLSRSIALDYAADGLRCNCICPGITDTPMLRHHLGSNATARLTARLQRVPIGRALQAKEIAQAALYFSCEDSAGITGTSLVIDGGYSTAAEWSRPDIELPGDLK